MQYPDNLKEMDDEYNALNDEAYKVTLELRKIEEKIRKTRSLIMKEWSEYAFNLDSTSELAKLDRKRVVSEACSPRGIYNFREVEKNYTKSGY